MRATTLCSSLALALALGSGACGGGDDGASAPRAPVAEKNPAAKPRRVESTPVPAQAQAPRLAPAPEPEAAPTPPSIPPDAPMPEGEERISDLPGDVPVPAGAQAVSPLLMSPEGISHGTYEMKGSASTAASSYTAGLLQKGWSVEPARNSGDQALITATKGDRQLSIAIDGSTGDRAQIVIFEMQRPPG